MAFLKEDEWKMTKLVHCSNLNKQIQLYKISYPNFTSVVSYGIIIYGVYGYIVIC